MVEFLLLLCVSTEKFFGHTVIEAVNFSLKEALKENDLCGRALCLVSDFCPILLWELVS